MFGAQQSLNAPYIAATRGFAAGGCGDPSPVTQWTKKDEKHRADKQQGDPHALDVEGDPRGGLQSEEYRKADPRDLVEEGDVVMGGPGGTPQDRDPEAR